MIYSENTARLSIPGQDEFNQLDATTSNSEKRQEQHMAWLAYHSSFHPVVDKKFFGDDLIAYMDECVNQARERLKLKQLAGACGNDDLLNY